MDFSPGSKKLIFFIIVIFFIMANLFTLPFFPFFHSDEIWLSNQSLDIFITKSFKTTESFFDLYPRTPHGLKLVFNSIQIIFGKLLGHNYITYRLISLIISFISLIYFYKVLSHKNQNTTLNLLLTLALGMNIQWFYMSHFARQEAFIVLIYIASFHLYLKDRPKLLALTIASGFLIHPNAYVIALMFFILFLLNKDKSSLVAETIIGGITTVLIIIISLILNPNFINAYGNYGSSLGVGDSLIQRTLNFRDFFIKLYYQISGTYYVPDIRLYLVALVILLVFSIFMIKKEPIIPATLWGFILGSWIIGRYNATSIIFLMPILYYGISRIINGFNEKIAIGLLILFLVYSTFTASVEAYAWRSDFDKFSESIDIAVPDEAVVLANLNMGYGLKSNHFYDYRNLGYLSGQSFVSYIEERDISYIIWTDEMDYIHRNENWQILYGNMDYYDDAKDYLENECTLVDQFTDNAYGVRIVRYMLEPEWNIYIYKVKGK